MNLIWIGIAYITTAGTVSAVCTDVPHKVELLLIALITYSHTGMCCTFNNYYTKPFPQQFVQSRLLSDGASLETDRHVLCSKLFAIFDVYTVLSPQLRSTFYHFSDQVISLSYFSDQVISLSYFSDQVISLSYFSDQVISLSYFSDQVISLSYFSDQVISLSYFS